MSLYRHLSRIIRLGTTIAAAVLALSVSAPGAVAQTLDADTLSRVRLTAQDPAGLARTLESIGLDVLEGSVSDASLDVIVSDDELRALRDLGLAPKLVKKGRPFRETLAQRGGPDAPPPGYLNLAEILDAMTTFAQQFPDICQMVDLTTTYNMPTTFQGRHMFAIKISDNVAQDEDETTILIVSDHHAREIVTPVIALETIDRLTSNYGSDPDITAAVDDNEIWIAPTWNPDGYNWVFVGDELWRKNRRVTAGGIGVDQNRNYPFGWSSSCGGSTRQSSQTYRGPEPASEPETQTMMAWSLERHFAKVIDYHSFGREVLFAYACQSHPFSSFLQQEARALASASGYGGDVRPPSAAGEHYEWQLAALSVHAFLIESANEFQPSHSSALAEAELVWPGILWMIQRPIPLTGHVRDARTGTPIEADIELLNVVFSNGESNSSGGPFGRYHAFLPTGQYEVEFSADGYETQTHILNVNSNTQMVFDVDLLATSDLLALEVDPLTAGQIGTMRTTNSTPTETVYFIYSLKGAGSTFVPALGITLDLQDPILAGSAVADAGGLAELTRMIPNGGAGRTVHIQAAEVGRKSNVVITTIN